MFFEYLLTFIVVVAVFTIPIVALGWLVRYIYRHFKSSDGEKEKHKMERPRVRGIIGLLYLNAAANGLVLIYIINLEADASQSTYTTIMGVIIGLIALLALGSAILIGQYKRIGLYLGVVYVGLSLIGGFILVLSGAIASVCGSAIWIVVAYYLYKYLMMEPYKSFFT